MQRIRSTLSREHAPEGRRTEIEEFVEALRAVTRGVSQFQRAAEQRWRVSSAQLLVLRILAEAPSASVNEIAARTETHQSTVSVVVGRLVRRGLVRRRRGAADGRRTELGLTPAGWGLHRAATAAELRHMSAALAALPSARVRELMDGLALIGGVLDGRSPPLSLEGDGDGRRRSPRLRRRAAAAP